MINAYITAAALALQVTPLVQKPELIHFRIQFAYEQMNDVLTICKQFECLVAKQEINLFCSLHLGIPRNRLDEVLDKINELQRVKAEKL